MTPLEIAQAVIFWSLYFAVQFWPPVLPIAYLPSTFDPRGFL